MKKAKLILALVLIAAIALTTGIYATSSADSNPGEIDNTNQNDVIAGNTPGSCGFLWDTERNGWQRPWDTDSLIPASEKPEWQEFIPNEVVDDVDDSTGNIIGGTPGSCGFQWDAERNGWHRPWDPDSFIPASEKPEWDQFATLPETKTAVFVNASIIGREILLSVGDELTISLDSNGSTGFRWILVENGAENIINNVDDEYVLDAAMDPPPPGTGGKEYWTFEAINQGETTIEMEYNQPWDGGIKAAKTFTLNIVVE